MTMSLIKSFARAPLRLSPGLSSTVISAYRKIIPEREHTGGTTHPLYCYAVWMRHLSMLLDAAPHFRYRTVVELGPGDTIGAGLAALFCGAERYYGLDSHPYLRLTDSLDTFDHLVSFYRQRYPIPSGGEFCDVQPDLPVYDFPRHHFWVQNLEANLETERLTKFRTALSNTARPAIPSDDALIRYLAPWRAEDLPPASVDFLFSQAVLEHVENMQMSYEAMARWVRPGGYISHTIDFRSHGTSLDWNGHWAYSKSDWKRANSHKAFRRINRLPRSAHLRHIENAGFEIVHSRTMRRSDGIKARHVSPDYEMMPDEDLHSWGIYVLARKNFSHDGLYEDR